MTDFISLFEIASATRRMNSDMHATRRREAEAKYEHERTFHLPWQQPHGLHEKDVSSGGTGSRAS